MPFSTPASLSEAGVHEEPTRAEFFDSKLSVDLSQTLWQQCMHVIEVHLIELHSPVISPVGLYKMVVTY